MWKDLYCRKCEKVLLDTSLFLYMYICVSFHFFRKWQKKKQQTSPQVSQSFRKSPNSLTLTSSTCSDRLSILGVWKTCSDLYTSFGAFQLFRHIYRSLCAVQTIHTLYPRWHVCFFLNFEHRAIVLPLKLRLDVKYSKRESKKSDTKCKKSPCFWVDWLWVDRNVDILGLKPVSKAKQTQKTLFCR